MKLISLNVHRSLLYQTSSNVIYQILDPEKEGLSLSHNYFYQWSINIDWIINSSSGDMVL